MTLEQKNVRMYMLVCHELLSVLFSAFAILLVAKKIVKNKFSVFYFKQIRAVTTRF